MSLVEIPQPKPVPLVGNAVELNPDAPVQSLMRLAREYGPIYRLELPTRGMLVVSSQELVNELCDPQRFDKHVHSVLDEIRAFAGDGLFTAHTEEANWGKAHRILMPAFGPMGLRDMFDPMLDIAEQLVLRWERFGEDARIDVPDQMTRLTLDTIALCAFDYRFNSFYREEMHPFVDAMVSGLAEAGARSRRLQVVNRLKLGTARRYAADIDFMHRVADELIRERRRDAGASDKKDLLARMMNARDPITGEGLSDENIRNQLVTFLIAGHETTSGLLSFALHLLLANPEVLEETRASILDRIGDETPTREDLPHLRFVEQVLMESLRLWPTAPGFAVKAFNDEVIGGKYAVTRDDVLFVLSPMLHRDTAVWGHDVERFDPHRFDRAAEAELPPHAWKPFGTGQRACIGRPFAMQEAVLVLTMILQRFDIIADDPRYELQIKETLTLKPDGFFIRAKRRGASGFAPRRELRRTHVSNDHARVTATGPQLDADAPSLLVLFGSNSGSSEAFAQRIASDATSRGFAARVASMDEFAGRLPTEGSLVVVTASYEGQPPDNARQFMAALETMDPQRLAGLEFAVFGCGNRQWARTYQAIPKRVDAGLEAAGARRVFERGEADAAGDFFGDFDEWYAGLWPALQAAAGTEVSTADEVAPELSVEVLPRGRSATLRHDDLGVGRVVVNEELVDMSHELGRSKRHFEIELPEGMRYRAGDYLAVLPRNPVESVQRVLRRFDLAPDAQLVLHRRADASCSLPVERPIAAAELLEDYVELAQPATRLQVRALASVTACPPEAKALEALADPEAHSTRVIAKRLSVLDLLEQYASCQLDFAAFLSMLPPLKPRQYSIASSPLWDEGKCALTVAVVDGPALSGQGRFRGVASNHLAHASPGTRLAVAVRPSQRHFHPPEDPKSPIVMICAGTGLAPFHGFLQERALQKRAGRDVGPAMLFFGCDHPEVDYLYREELEAWAAEGVVDLRPAFTFDVRDGVKFVQDRVWKDRNDLAAIVREGATVYLCGDGQRMAPAVRDTLARIYAEERAVDHEEALHIVETIERERGRFVEDVFA